MQTLSFEDWKVRLRKDCEREDKLSAYAALGEECLRILWEQGTGPSVQGVMEGGKQEVQLLASAHTVPLRLEVALGLN